MAKEVAGSSSVVKTEDTTKEDEIFECYLCGLKEKYHYFGKKPPFAKQITFLEEAFVAKDPFVPRKQGLFLLLGSLCIICGKKVCQSQECSIYYTKRLCLPCAKNNLNEFPRELRKLLEK